MKVAVVGATGMVGRKILTLLEERNFPVEELLPVGSKSSVGKQVLFKDKEYVVLSVEEAIEAEPNLAIFSAGGSLSLKEAPRFVATGTTVVDNSSAWRMHVTTPLIIPEINAKVLKPTDKIIANPNCSTIQMLMALAPIHKEYGIKRIIVSTYQSITGTGVKAVEQMEAERRGEDAEKVYPYEIDKNCLPHCDVFLENDYTKEEMKLVEETQKILDAPEMRITATAVRVPVVGGHSESINVELEKAFTIEGIREVLGSADGVVVQDDVANLLYPMPLLAHDKDEVFVGRIRRDTSCHQALNLWVVADNIRKGAATNAVQIAEYLLKKDWL
ncbi:aspartate-semialdehyde dehydrogenase [Balneicella halophila]|uniref:Aspartate-semialdehyde dehydrogenase n=1 Tax=Balneicella halophila TaxID=1537566 RepID=A0A7L4UQX6_BALHA|nr:aspartate-semialdehyde dehydrogenase [Balneicella halophila]PVX52178.1 aspartate-semialdehyde dehydrogenase [Balneicella halophila]